MNASIITCQEDFLELCDHIKKCGIVSFDSEFISDTGYRPQLGLLQFATPERCVAVDPLEVTSLSPWWEIMADDCTTVIVHGGQAEIRFCVQHSGHVPRRLVDIQIAEGLRGRSYPLSYNAIVERVLGTVITNSQTRTDWLRRPLSDEQIAYALEDVSYVPLVWERQRKWLESKGRLEWATMEFDRMCQSILDEEKTTPWERLSGIHKLPRRELAVAQRLAVWREEEAAERNKPARRVLRDDLLIEVIEEAGRIPDDKLPRRIRSRDDSSSDDQIISRLLALALGNVCAELEIAQALVGTNKDLTELVKYVRTGESSDLPLLLSDWRGEICGDLLKKVLEGRVRFRVAPYGSSTPLIFEDQPE